MGVGECGEGVGRGWGGWLKLALRDPNPRFSFHSGKKHIFVRSMWRSSNSSMNHYSWSSAKFAHIVIRFKYCFVVYYGSGISHTPDLY